MKKWINILIIGLLSISFSACSNPGKSGENQIEGITVGDAGGLKLPLDKNNTQLSILVTSEVPELNDKLVINALRQVTGLNIQIEAYPSATVSEKVKVLAASKKLPDIVGAGLGSAEALNDLAVQGAFASVDDKLNLMPNFKRIFYDMPENKWIFSSYQAEDGHLYLIPYYDFQRDVNHGMLYRKDIFDRHGLKVWNSTQEYYEVMKKLKELYPASTPFTSKTQVAIFNQLSTSWGLNAFNPYYHEEEKVWKYSDTDPVTKEMLDFIKKMYDEELFDPEFLTLTQSTWTQKMTQADKAFTTFDWIGRLEMFQEQTAGSVVGYDLRYAPPIGPKGTVMTLSKIGGGTAVSAGKNMDLALKLTDFFFSDAGAQLITLGVENKTYTIGTDGMADYIGFEEGKAVSINELEEKYGMFVNGIYKRFDRRSTYYNFTEREREAQDFAVKGNRFEPADPVVALSKEEKAIVTAKMPNLKKAAEEFFTAYILGNKNGDAAWAEWQVKAKSLGSDEIIDCYNAAQKRLDEAI